MHSGRPASRYTTTQISADAFDVVVPLEFNGAVEHDKRVGTTWIGGRDILVYVPTPKFLRRQTVCKLYPSPSDEAINRGTSCVHTYKKVRNRS